MTQEEVGEKGPLWYDQTFENNEQWSGHYTRSEYYFLWTVIADRIQQANVSSVLEIGCGSGQLAALLRDRGLQDYRGLDFSPKRIEHARAICPEFEFVQENAFFSNLFKAFDYDLLLTTEFLEHVENDLAILQKIKPGSLFLGTVPNFPFVSHVRHFRDADEVADRYQSYFDDFRISEFVANDKGITFYLMEGRVAPA